MPQRRGQRRNKRGKQAKSSGAANEELSPLSLLAGNSPPLPSPLPAHTAAVPGLAEWYLPYKRTADHSVTDSDEKLVLQHGVDVSFDDRARKKAKGRLQPVLPFDRAAAIRMLHTVQDTVTDATTNHLSFMSRGRADMKSRGASWAPSAASRLEGSLLLPHDSQLRSTEDADPRMDLEPHLVGSIVADVIDDMHLASTLRLMQQRLRARCQNGQLAVPPLGPPPAMKDLPAHLQQLQSLVDYAARAGPALLADAVTSCAWVGLLLATLSNALQRLQFVLGLVRRFMAATWHENQKETPNEFHDSDLSVLLSDTRAMMSRLQRAHDLLLRCNAQESSAVAALKRFADIVHPEQHALDAAADTVDDVFESRVASAPPGSLELPDCDCLQDWPEDATVQLTAPDLAIHGYKDFEEPSVRGDSCGSDGASSSSSSAADVMYLRQLVYLREQYREPGQPEGCIEADTRTRCSAGPHVVLRNLAWRPGGERGLLRAGRMHAMLSKLQVVLPAMDSLCKHVASFFCKHVPLIVACDFQFRSMLLHVQRSPGGLASLQLWRRSNILSMHSDLTGSALLTDLTWVQCFNHKVEEVMFGGAEIQEEGPFDHVQRDLAEGEAERRTMMLPPMLLQGGIIRPLLGAAAQLLVQGRPGADALLQAASSLTHSSSTAQAASGAANTAGHTADDTDTPKSTLKLPAALVKLASAEQRRRLQTALPPLMDVLFSPAEAAQFLKELTQCSNRDALEQEIVSIEHTLQDMHGDGSDGEEGEEGDEDFPHIAAGPVATGCAGLLVQDLEAFTPAALQEAQGQVDAAVAAVCSAGLGPEMPFRIAQRPELQPLRQHKRHAPPRARSGMYGDTRHDLREPNVQCLQLPGMLGEVSEADIAYTCNWLKDGDAYSLESLEAEMWQVGPDRLMESCTGALQDWQEHQSFLMATLSGSASNWMAQQPLGAGVALRQRLSIAALNRFRAASNTQLGRLTDAIAAAFKDTIALKPPGQGAAATSPVPGWLQRTTGLHCGCELEQTKAELLECAQLMQLSEEATTQLLFTRGRAFLAERLACSSRSLRALMLQATHRTMAAMHFEGLAAFLDFELVLCTQSQRLALLTAGTRGASGDAPAHLRLAAAAGIPGEEYAASVRLQPPTASLGVLTEALSARGGLDAPSCLLARQAAAALRAWWASAVPNAHASALAKEDEQDAQRAPASRAASAAVRHNAVGAAAASPPPVPDSTPSSDPPADAPSTVPGPLDALSPVSPDLQGLGEDVGQDGAAAAPLDCSWIEVLLSTAAAEGGAPGTDSASGTLGGPTPLSHDFGSWQQSWQPGAFGVDLGGGMWHDDHSPSAAGDLHTGGQAPGTTMMGFQDNAWPAHDATATLASMPPPPGLPEVPALAPSAEPQAHSHTMSMAAPLSAPQEQAVLRLFSREQLQALAQVHSQSSGQVRKLAAAAAVGAAQAVLQVSQGK